MEEIKKTWQDLFVLKLFELGGEATSEQMAEAITRSKADTIYFARELQKRRLVLKTDAKMGCKGYAKYKINLKESNRINKILNKFRE